MADIFTVNLRVAARHPFHRKHEPPDFRGKLIFFVQEFGRPDSKLSGQGGHGTGQHTVFPREVVECVAADPGATEQLRKR